MNEMTKPGISPGDGALSLGHGPDIQISFPFGEIVRALAEAKQTIEPPRRTRRIESYDQRSGRSYTYSYAPLEEVERAVTAPLAVNGLILTQMPRGGRELDIVLLHTSGQWMMCTIPLITREDGFTDYSGALTSARRIGIQALLSLAADDDNDGQINQGNSIRTPHWDPEREAEERSMDPLAVQAQYIGSAAQACDLLDAANSRFLTLNKMRAKPESRKAWSDTIYSVAIDLKRVLGPTIAAAWRDVAIAETPEEEAEINRLWHNDWDDTLQRFRTALPNGFAALTRWMNEHRGEISRRAKQASMVRQAAAAPVPVMPVPEPSLTGREAALQAQDEVVPDFFFAVMDANGEPCTEPFSEPAQWARAFADIRTKSDDDELDGLDGFNLVALTAANEHVGAEIILREAFAVPADPEPAQEESPADDLPEMPAIVDVVEVEVPKRRGGGIDDKAYLAALQEAIGMLRTDDDLARFEELNAPNYTSTAVLSMKTLKMLAGRKRALGIPLPEGAL